MQIRQVSLVYFSPTGSVRHTLQNIAAGIGLPAREYDLTPFAARWEKYPFAADDLVLIGMPVYNGRVPGILTEFFRGLRGNPTPAVFVVSYGNQDAGAALPELKSAGERRGFTPVAAAAFGGAGRIAMAHPAGAEENGEFLFGRQIREKIDRLDSIAVIEDLKVKGGLSSQQRAEYPQGPATNDHCQNCGMCAQECPLRAINPADPKEVDDLRCIKCFRCVLHCPNGAKYFRDPEFQKQIVAYSETCATSKEPEIYL